MRRLALFLASLPLIAFGCYGPRYTPPGTGGSGGTGGGSTSGQPTTTSSSSTSTSGTTSTGTGGGTPGVLCPAIFNFQAPNGAQNIRVAGEWEGFDLSSAPMMTSQGGGSYSVTVKLNPGLWAYKIVYDDTSQTTNWIFDPAQGRRKYVGGTENSAMKVPDCSLPSFNVTSTQATRPSAGMGTYQAQLAYQDAVDASGPDTKGFTATVIHDGTTTTLTASQLVVDAGGNAKVNLSGLGDGKYTVLVKGKTKSGQVGDAQRLIFWIEQENFSWSDALIYMVMTDRYRDGDSTNNIPSPTPGSDPRGDFLGGDLQGIKQSITDGTFDKLGVRALWISPFPTNPPDAYLAADGVHKVTGYHGYWPIKGREVDARWGGNAALKALVVEAHKHGIRVLQDYVIHHVHQDHEYVKAHPDWFILNGCVCGTNNCDWTVHAQDCKFTDYLPNIDHKNPDADQAFVDDARWWLDTFDLDGFRIDAVKHVPEAATRNLAAEVREGYEKGGTHYFLMGETAMGWSDCADPCNDTNYGTIANYIGPQNLDGQIDFVLYYAASTTAFAYGDRGMIHADYWFNHGMQKWPPGAVMTPYLGSQDTPRFGSLANYRGQDAAHDRGIPSNQWTSIAGAPTDSEPYRRTRIAMAWLLGLPGAPLMYYGDEYGQWGGADPNNRTMWKNEGTLTADESATLAFVRKLGLARKGAPSMRRGSYVQLYNTDDNTLVFGRLVSAGQASIVGITRLGSAANVSVDVSKLGFAAGTVLHDGMGGPDVTIPAGGMVSIAVPASGAVVLSP